MTPTSDTAWTWDVECAPSSGCLDSGARHPDPSLFKGTLSTKAHSNLSSGLHRSTGEIPQISLKVSKGHAFSLLCNRKESWDMKVGMKGGNLSGRFGLLFRVQTSFVYFSFPLKTAEVWDFERGRQLFELSNAHGETETTCLTFENSGRATFLFIVVTSLRALLPVPTAKSTVFESRV